MSTEAGGSAEPLLRMRGIRRSFPGVRALDGVDFEVRAGEVHALMGQNGAGKSTLIKVLTGVHAPEAGSIRFLGRPYRASSPADAQRRGVSTVFQEINLVPTLSVAENLFAGRLPGSWLGVNWRATAARARELLARFDLKLDVHRPLGAYPVATQQVVAIARAVDLRARLLVLDEPTSSLDARETEVLFALMDRLRSEGMGLVFVTHFLEQVYRISDRITVLRNGRHVGTWAARDLSRVDLVAHMLGSSPAPPPHPGGTSRGEAVVRGGSAVPSLRVRGLGRKHAIEPFDAAADRGEVLGLAGLLGAGRTEAARLIFGADRPAQGRVEVEGRPVRSGSPRAAIAAGIGFCPEDRKADGIVPGMSVRENIALVVQRRLGRFGLVSRRAQTRLAERLVAELGIATPDLDRPVRTLSGGNQQKVILARWLAARPRILILDEPTRGIDVGSKAQIESIVEELARGGMTLVFISAELDEVARRADRVLVLRDRRVVGEVSGDDLTESGLMRAIAGEGSDAG